MTSIVQLALAVIDVAVPDKCVVRSMGVHHQSLDIPIIYYHLALANNFLIHIFYSLLFSFEVLVGTFRAYEVLVFGTAFCDFTGILTSCKWADRSKYRL